MLKNIMAEKKSYLIRVWDTLKKAPALEQVKDSKEKSKDDKRITLHDMCRKQCGVKACQ